MSFSFLLTIDKNLEIARSYDKISYDLGEALTYLNKEAATRSNVMSGRLYASTDGAILLDVPNSLIRGSFDALSETGLTLPGKNGKFNGHIVAMTTEEVRGLKGVDSITERGHRFNYNINSLQEAPLTNSLHHGKVWFFSVASQDLSKLRKSYGLSPTPGKHGFHIVVALRKLGVLGNNGISKQAWSDRVDAWIDSETERSKTAASLSVVKVAASQDSVYDLFKASLPEDMASKLQHVSGGLPDARGLSDVDVGYVTPDYKNLMFLLPEGTSVKHKADSAVYTVPGYDRPVGLYATSNPSLIDRSKTHREVAYGLAAKYPELLEKVKALKKSGLGTEPSWAKALNLQGDPYEAMLDRGLLTSETERSKTAASYQATGNVQGVGLRATLHDLLNKGNMPGLAVNNPYTGNVDIDLPLEPTESDDVITRLRNLLDSGEAGKDSYQINKVEKANKLFNIVMDKKNIDRFVNRQGFKPLGMETDDYKKQWLTDRYRLTNEGGNLTGKVAPMAYRQLRGLEPVYSEESYTSKGKAPPDTVWMRKARAKNKASTGDKQK